MNPTVSITSQATEKAGHASESVAATKGSRSRKASLNSLAAMFDYGARLIVGFLLKPLLVAGLGTYAFGVWEVLGKMTGYLGPAAGQAGHALRWTTANQQSSDDYAKKQSNVGSAFGVWLVLMPVFCLLMAVIAWWSPTWLSTTEELKWVIRGTALLLGLNVAMTSLTEIPRSVLEGENLAYKRLGLSALLVLLGGGLMAVAVWFELGLIGLAGTMLINTCLTGLFFLQVVRQHVAWFGIRRPSRDSIKQFFGLSGWFLSWNMVTRLMRASDVLVLGIMGSLELVTIYSLTKYAPETAINFVAILVFGITPGLGGIIGKGDLKKAATIRTEMLSLTWLIATVAGATTLLWNQTFLSVWVGNEFNAGSLGTLLMVVMVTQFVLLRTDGSVIDLTLKLRGKVLMGLISATVSIVLAGILVGHYELGIVGLCLGIIAGRTILTFAYPWFVGRFLGHSPVKQFAHAVRPAVVTGLIFFASMEYGSRFEFESWFKLVLGVGVTLVSLPVPLTFLGLPSEIRTRIFKRIQNVAASFKSRRKS